MIDLITVSKIPQRHYVCGRQGPALRIKGQCTTYCAGYGVKYIRLMIEALTVLDGLDVLTEYRRGGL